MAGIGKELPKIISVLYLLLQLSATTQGSDSIKCLSANGKPTDWFIVIKLPAKTMGANHFYYMDDSNPSWTLADSTLDQPSNAVYYTLQQVYNKGTQEPKKSQEMMYLMYNDEKPLADCARNKSASTTHGHTKGVIAFDESTGFWLIHSMPKYPQRQADGYRWCDNVDRYAQSFLCISMSTSQALDKIGSQLLYNYPQIYDYSMPSSFKRKYPTMTKSVAGQRVTEYPWQQEVKLMSLAGVPFISFAKYSKFDADLYSDWLAPRFKQTLFVESFQRLGIKLCSNCTGEYKVYNVEDVTFQEGYHTYTETTDHSKWAVTNSSSSPWTCIGDINRQKSQLTRPGGTVCFTNTKVWQSFHGLVQKYHDCNPYSGCVRNQ